MEIISNIKARTMMKKALIISKAIIQYVEKITFQ